MRIAIQCFGEVRHFDIFTQVLQEYRAAAKDSPTKYDFSIDFHITTWDNDYTRNLDFSIFDSFNLIKSPQEGLRSMSPKKGNKQNIEGASSGFFNASYSMFVGAYNRFEYQKKNNIHYDWILLQRPDFYLHSLKLIDLVRGLYDEKYDLVKGGNDFHIIYSSINKSLESKWSSFLGQDHFWIGKQEAIDLFCKNFHLCYLNDDGSFFPSYHNLPKHTIDRYHLFHDTNKALVPRSLHKIWPIRFDYVKKDGKLTPIDNKGDKK